MRRAVIGLALLALAGCGSNEAAPPATTAATSTTVAESTTTTEPTPTGLPADAVRVETTAGPIWVSGQMAYAAGCATSGLTEESATAALTAAGYPPTGGFTSWGLFCQN